MQTSERILCAAIWYKDLPRISEHVCRPKNIDRGIVLCGWRHGDVIAQMCELKGLRTVENGEDSVGDHEQGFLTDKNRFVDRAEAMTIAELAHQLIEARFRDELYSEDLY